MSVSVIVPNYNNAAFLARCLNSVVNDPAVSEVVVYDDSSTDASISIISRFADAKVRVIEGSLGPIGIGPARACAIAESSSPYLAMLDGDDFLEELTISHCLKRAIADNLDICAVKVVLVDVDEGNHRPFVPAPTLMAGQTAILKTLGRWQFDPGSGIIRRELYQKAAEGFNFYGYSADEFLGRRMVKMAHRIGGAEGTYFYRLGPRQPSDEQVAMRLITYVRSLELAADVPGAEARAILSAGRKSVFRNLLVQSMRNSDRKSLLALQQAGKEARHLPIPWRIGDLPYRVAMGVADRILAART